MKGEKGSVPHGDGRGVVPEEPPTHQRDEREEGQRVPTHNHNHNNNNNDEHNMLSVCRLVVSRFMETAWSP